MQKWVLAEVDSVFFSFFSQWVLGFMQRMWKLSSSHPLISSFVNKMRSKHFVSTSIVYDEYNFVWFSLWEFQDTFCQMWNLISIPDFESKGENPLNVCETVKLCQKRTQTMIMFCLGAIYSNFLDDELSHTEINYVRKRIQTMIMFFLGAIIVTYDESPYAGRPDSNHT